MTDFRFAAVFHPDGSMSEATLVSAGANLDVTVEPAPGARWTVTTPGGVIEGGPQPESLDLDLGPWCPSCRSKMRESVCSSCQPALPVE